MLTKTTQEENIINKISKVTVVNQLVETIYVDDSIGSIESTKTLKEGHIVRETTEKIDYKLKTHRLIVKTQKNSDGHLVISDVPKNNTIFTNKCICDCASIAVNRTFISELKSSKKIVKNTFKFFKQGLLKRVFNENTDDKLVKNILDFGHDCSWMIVPVFIFDIIKESEWFTEIENNSKSLIRKEGKLGEIDVYLNEDENDSIIYFANYDSITVVINNNIKIDRKPTVSNIYSEGKVVSVDYLFIENGLTKMLTIS